MIRRCQALDSKDSYPFRYATSIAFGGAFGIAIAPSPPMTTALTLALLVLLTFPSQDDPITDLVRRLHHDDIAVRDAAETALAARGEDSLPALREQAATAGDPEVRSRIKRVIDRITGLDWQTDLAAALKVAAAQKKNLFVLSSPAGLGAPS